MKEVLSSPSVIQVWAMAVRPKTLPAAMATVIVGIGAAIGDGVFHLAAALAALSAALLLQIGANLANDVFDFRRGADQEGRLGPVRVTQAGLLTPRQVLAGMWVTFGLAALLGLYLTHLAGWPVVVIGALSILAAIAYTGGPWPIGYYGLGDLFVFLFFGLVAVAGTYFVQALTVNAKALAAAVPMGLLTVNLLVVNNLRDIDSDRKVGKRTLAVRLGAGGVRREYILCLIGSYCVPLLLVLFKLASPWVMLSWLSIPMAVQVTKAVLHQQGRSLNLELARSGKLLLIFGILFAIGIAQ